MSSAIVDESRLAGTPQVLGVLDELDGGSALTIEETLIEVVLAGPGPEAMQLLTGLWGRPLTEDDKLTVAELWWSQAAWVAGQQNLALTNVAAEVASPSTAGDFRDGDWVYELALALTQAVRFALADRAAEGVPADPADASGVAPTTERRTKDQRMADAQAWFILGPDPQHPAQPREPDVVVQVTIDLLTLMHLRDHPGELGRFGLIPAEIARQLADDAAWQRFVHEPVTGHPLDLGNSRYAPTKELNDFIRARDVRSRFPGSTRRADKADLDHLIAYGKDGEGGSTSADNLAALGRKASGQDPCRLRSGAPRRRRHRVDHAVRPQAPDDSARLSARP